MPKYILTVTLNPALDSTVFLTRFAPEQRVCDRDVVFSPGGKGINVSRALNKLGLRTLASGFLPKSDFSGFCGLLDQEMIGNDFFKVNGRLRRNITRISRDSNRLIHTLDISSAMLITKNDLNGMTKKLLMLFKKAECVVFSGSVPKNLPYDYLATLVSAAKCAGLPVLVDTSGRAYLAAIKARPYLIKPNLEELRQLAHSRLSPAGLFRQIGQISRSYGIKIALTLAEKGALLTDGQFVLKAEVPPVKSLNTVGCGDAFMAGFIKGMVDNTDEGDKLRLAVACGTAAATGYLPADITRQKVFKIYRKVVIKEISLPPDV
jgi:tagatose 6-phosphate kinase